MGGQSYLFLGPEIGDKGDRIAEIKRLAGPDAESYKVFPFDSDIQNLPEYLYSSSLFSPSRFIWLDLPKEYTADRKSLMDESLKKIVMSYLANPSDQVTFVITTVETTVPADLKALLPANNVQIFYELFDNQKSQWLARLFARMNLTLTKEATDLFLEMVENNTEELRAVGTQLGMYMKDVLGKRSIEASDIESYLTHTRSEEPSSVFSFLAQRKLEAALASAQSLLAQDPYSSTRITGALAQGFDRLLSYRQGIDDGLDQKSAFKAARSLGSPRPVAFFRDQDVFKKAASLYNQQQLLSIVALIGDYDNRIKEAGSVSDLMLENLLYLIVTA